MINANGCQYSDNTQRLEAVCIDGCDPTDLEAAFNVMPKPATIIADRLAANQMRNFDLFDMKCTGMYKTK